MDNKIKILLILGVIAIIGISIYFYNKNKQVKLNSNIPNTFVYKLKVYFSNNRFPNITEEDVINIANRRYKNPLKCNETSSNLKDDCDLNNLAWWCLEGSRKYSETTNTGTNCQNPCKDLAADSDACKSKKNLCNDNSDLCYKDLSTATNDEIKKFLDKRSELYTGGSGLGSASDNVLCSRIFPNNVNKNEFWGFDVGSDITKVVGKNTRKNIANELNKCYWNKKTDGGNKKDFSTLG